MDETQGMSSKDRLRTPNVPTPDWTIENYEVIMILFHKHHYDS